MPLRLYKGPWIGSPASETLEAMEELHWSCDCEGSDGSTLGEKKSWEEKHKARPRQHAQLSEWNGEVSHCVCTYRPELSEVPEWEVGSEWKSEIDFASRRVVIKSLTVHTQNALLSILFPKYGTERASDIPRAHRIAAMLQGWRIEISFCIFELELGRFRTPYQESTQVCFCDLSDDLGCLRGWFHGFQFGYIYFSGW